MSADILFQSIFGYNILGFQQIDDGVNSGFFGSELVAGGYLQRLSIPALFFLYYLLRNNKNYNSFMLVMGISFIGIGIILASNRMPFLTFLVGMFLFFLACKNLRKSILVGTLVVLISFVFIFKNHNYTNEKFHSFVGAIERMVKYMGIQISGTIKKTTQENYEEKSLDRIYYKKGSGHLELYRAAIITFKENYIFGSGPKNFFNSCIKINDRLKKLGKPIDCNLHPHNYYLEILTSLGIIGIILFIYIFYKLCKIFFKKSFNRNLNFNNINNLVFTSSLITIIIELFPLKSSGSFFSTSSAIYIFLFMAMMIGTKENKSKTKNL